MDSKTEAKSCLNCGDKLTGDFCHVCGQSADTERYSTTHFAREAYQVIRKIEFSTPGVTLWQLVRRPGAFVRDYLAGKRVGFAGPARFFFFAFIAEILLRTTINQAAGPDFVHDTNLSSTWVQLSDFVATIFWGVLWRLFYPKSGLNVAECAVAGLYFQGATGFLGLIVLLVTIPIRYLAPASAVYFDVSDLLVMIVYSFVFAYSLFGESIVKTFIKQTILLFLFFTLLILVLVGIKSLGLSVTV